MKAEVHAVRLRGHGNLGFTLIELLVVVAIIAIAAAIGIPSFLKARRDALLDNRTRELVTMIARAQAEAITGRELTGAAAGVTGKTRQAGVRFIDANTYVVFADDDANAAQVEIVARVDLTGGGGGGLSTSEASSTEVEIEDVTIGGVTQTPPAGLEFRFRNDATVVNSDNVIVRLVDREMQKRSVIQVSVAGQSSVTRERL